MGEQQTDAEKAAEKAAREKAAREKAEREAAERAQAEAAAQPRDARYSRERLLGPDGFEITGHPVGVIAGALDDAEGEDFSREELDKLIAAFLEREDTSQTAEQAKQADEEANR